jgi:hypothetical protein
MRACLARGLNQAIPQNEFRPTHELHGDDRTATVNEQGILPVLAVLAGDRWWCGLISPGRFLQPRGCVGDGTAGDGPGDRGTPSVLRRSGGDGAGSGHGSSASRRCPLLRPTLLSPIVGSRGPGRLVLSDRDALVLPDRLGPDSHNGIRSSRCRVRSSRSTCPCHLSRSPSSNRSSLIESVFAFLALSLSSCDRDVTSAEYGSNLCLGRPDTSFHESELRIKRNSWND